MNDDKPFFQGVDEFERTYAPQELPVDDPERARVQVEGDDVDDSAGASTLADAPSAAPVATTGTSPSAIAAPPNIGHEDHGGAPGDPQTEARNPVDN